MKSMTLLAGLLLTAALPSQAAPTTPLPTGST